MANYKVVYRADRESGENRVLWEPGCPVYLEAVQVSRNTETGEAFLQIKAQNVSGAIVESLVVDAYVAYGDDDSQSIEINELDADIRPGASFTFKPVGLERGDVASASVHIRRVVSADGAWKSTGEAKPVPVGKKLHLSDKAMAERKARLGTAGSNPDVLAVSPVVIDEWWVCGCGQANVGTEFCVKCGADSQLTSSLVDEEQLEAWADERKVDADNKQYVEAVALQEKGGASALKRALAHFEALGAFEDAPIRAERCRDALSQAKKASAKKTKIAIAVIAIVVVIAVAAYAVVTKIVIPTNEYNDAVAMAERGEYDEAIAAFEALGDFKDAPAKIEEARLARVQDIVDEGNAKRAEGDFMGAISSYEKAGIKELVRDAQYDYIMANYDNGNWTTYKYLKTLMGEGYKDAAELYDDLYAWHVEMNMFEAPNDNPSLNVDKLIKLQYVVTGGEPEEVLEFNVIADSTYIINRSDVTRSNSVEDSFSVREGVGTRTLWQTATSAYDMYNLNIKITAAGETISETFQLK